MSFIIGVTNSYSQDFAINYLPDHGKVAQDH